MARILGLPPEKAGVFARIVYWFTKRSYGRVLAPIGINAHHPRLFRAMIAMERGQAAAHTVPQPLKILAGIKAASLTGCPF